MTPKDLVLALGGATAVAEHLGVGKSAVSMWNQRGIPPEHYIPLWRLARERGVEWTPPNAAGLLEDCAR